MKKPEAKRVAVDALSKRRLRLWLRILKVSRLLSAELRNNLRDGHETTLPRFDVMAALYRSENGLRMSELSGALAVSNGNVTGIVDRLADDGHLVRIPVADDRRATEVRLTRKGRDYFAALASEHEIWVDDLLSSLDGAETDELNRLLETIARGLDSKDKKP
ncbi:MAG: MarR family transcriptional regulator [Hyphomicrobiaceae bacterium]